MEDKWPPPPADPAEADRPDGFDDGERPGEDTAGEAVCPACGAAFDPAASPAAGAPVRALLQCPACGEQFFAVTESDEDDGAEVEDADDPQRRAGRGGAGPDTEELDGLRIRQVSVLRRGAIRAQSYCIIAAGGCLVGAGQLVFMTVKHVRERGWEKKPVGYVIFAVLALMAATYFWRLVVEYARELRRPGPEAERPEAEPDFSTLSDGSHQWKNLEKLR